MSEQNTIRIYRNPDTDVWRASIGDIETQGHSGCQALGFLIHRLHKGGYRFDPDWWPTDPESPQLRDHLVTPLTPPS